jgi:GWxTD domain-containing protein
MSRNSLGTCMFLGLLLVVFSLPVAAQSTTHRVIAPPWRKWLNEDVVWIITPGERAAFKKLTTDEQRDEFVIAFWERRNPDPGSPENKFKEEHYRRIAYANNNFAFDVIPGWMTDRGRTHIIYGPPDSVERHANFTPLVEIWHYASLEECSKVTLTFTDKNGGDYLLNDADVDWLLQMREAR